MTGFYEIPERQFRENRNRKGNMNAEERALMAYICGRTGNSKTTKEQEQRNREADAFLFEQTCRALYA